MKADNDNRPIPGALPEPMDEHDRAMAETETIERSTKSGEPADVDPDTADRMGAFEEDALDETDADDSRFDVDPETGVVLDDPDDGDTDNGEMSHE